MPTICMFYGILVSMFYEDDQPHHLPHIHVRYGQFKAAVSIPDGVLLAGSLPPRQFRLLQAWIELQQDALLADWALAVSGEPLFRIPPL